MKLAAIALLGCTFTAISMQTTEKTAAIPCAEFCRQRRTREFYQQLNELKDGIKTTLFLLHNKVRGKCTIANFILFNGTRQLLEKAATLKAPPESSEQAKTKLARLKEKLSILERVTAHRVH